MARGDFVDGGKSKFASRNVYSGISWRYANTSEQAIQTNSDIIEIFPYLWKDNTLDTYANDFRNSYVEITIDNTTTTQIIRTKYNFGYASQNTNYYLTTAYSSQNPFGYGVPSDITYITSTTKDGETIYGARFEVPHNQDGSSPSVTVKWHLEAYSSHGNVNHTTNLLLDTIPRTSQPTCDNVTLGTQTIIYTNRVSNSFTHTINIKIGDTILDTFTNVGESQPWTPTTSIYAPYITTSTTGVATIECITYNNGTQLGTATTTCVLTVPDNIEPSCTISIAKGDNVVPSNWNVYVKNKSKLAVTITGTAQYGATISTYSSSANGSNYNTSTYTTNELTGSGNVTAKVIDSRGYASSQATTPYTVIDYSNPQITTNTVDRCDVNGTLKDDGTYVKYSFAGSISPINDGLNDLNDKSFTLKYCEKGTSNWTTINTWTSDYVLNNVIDVIYGSGNIDNTKEYVFRFEATDTFTTVSKEIEIGTGADLINFNASGKSMAIGGVSQRGANEEYTDVFTNIELHGETNIIDIYTNTERKIGIWVDNKPIYRKVISTTTPNDNTPTSIGTIIDIDTLIKPLSGVVKSGTQQIPLNFVYNTEQNSLYIEGTNVVARITASAYQNKDCIIIAEYTKTTD